LIYQNYSNWNCDIFSLRHFKSRILYFF